MSNLQKAEDLARMVTVVTVCYNSNEVVKDMLGSLPKTTPVVLVDNASQDVNELEGQAYSYGARLIKNEINRGFGTACNQGAALGDTPFILFLNPDARLQPGALEKFVAAADQYPSASAMNPRISTTEGRPLFKRSSVLIDKREKMDRCWPSEDCEVPILSGAAFFVRRSAFESVGGFDPKIFLYHEDDDLSLRLRIKYGPLYFIRDAHAEHLSGRSSVRSPEVAALKAWHMGRSKVYVMRKHKRPFSKIRPLLSALFQLCSPLVLFSPRKRAKQFSFLKGVLSAFEDDY